MRTVILSTFIYACESWTVTVEIERRTQALEICYRRLLNISYKDHVTNEEVLNRIQNLTGVHDDLLTMCHRVNFIEKSYKSPFSYLIIHLLSHRSVLLSKSSAYYFQCSYVSVAAQIIMHVHALKPASKSPSFQSFICVGRESTLLSCTFP